MGNQRLKCAIIISGLLRLAKENTLILKDLAERYDVFVCTSLEDKNKTQYLGDIKAVEYIEEDCYMKELQNNLLEIPEGPKLLQWHKLSRAFSILEAYEAKNNIEYDCVYKIRTDLKFNYQFKLNVAEHFSTHRTMYMNSDIYFGGNRKVMKIASSFFLKALVFYCNNAKFNEFDLRLLQSSELAAGKFEWLDYPLELATGFECFFEFWKYITKKGIKDLCINSKEVKNFRPNHESIFFPSEAAFLNYLLVEGINVKKIHDKPFRIDENRKFNSLEEDTYKFLQEHFEKCNYKKMIEIYSNCSSLSDKAADLYRDAALKVFPGNHTQGLELITIANNVRPHGPYIKRLKHEFEEIIEKGFIK